jgi:hypothetical protein
MPRDVALALPIEAHEAGELATYKMTFPFLPPSKNVWDGWPGEWKAGVKQKWIRAIVREVETQDMPLGLQKIGLAAVLTFPSRNRRDPQNFSNQLWNFCCDGLVRAGVVVDDSEGHIEIGRNWGIQFSYDLRTQIDKKRRQRTHLAISMRVPK